MMRWTSRARFLFLAPAVLWVLAFTVFPLGYSLCIAFLKIDSKTEITRERVPMFDKAGNPVMLANGKQRMRTIIHKEQKTTRFRVSRTSGGCSRTARSRRQPASP